MAERHPFAFAAGQGGVQPQRDIQQLVRKNPHLKGRVRKERK